MRKNNLFEFATGELSQDAMICWCINWFNDSSKPTLQKMGKRIVKEISGEELINSVDIHRQFSKKVFVSQKTIQVKIDVLLIVNKSIPVIIEDKIFTSEHSNQINRYVEGITELVKQNGGKLEIDQEHSYEIDYNKIKTVYWKTGHYYDSDKVVIADVYFDSSKILSLIEPYAIESEIISDYVSKLKSDKEWYEIHKKYWEYSEAYHTSHWDLNIARHEIAQYYLMRDFFPKKLWNQKMGKYNEVYQVYSGSSSGRPWTEMIVHKGTYKELCNYSVFWRIDTDTKAPYLSLRLYEDAYCDKTKSIHGELWELMCNKIEEILDKENIGIKWSDVNPGNKKNCNEASVFHYRFTEENRNRWESEKENVIDSIRRLNGQFMNWISTVDIN